MALDKIVLITGRFLRHRRGHRPRTRRRPRHPHVLGARRTAASTPCGRTCAGRLRTSHPPPRRHPTGRRRGLRGRRRAALSPVDAIVNNAGIMPLSPLASLKVDEWDG